MQIDRIIWDLEGDPRGNVRHVAEHGLTPDEVDEVLHFPDQITVSRRSGQPCVFGFTSTGKYLVVIFERIDEGTAYPITAYEVPEL